jgi:glutathione synthase/RimK-type ligase-like ATP-grasp enzyme
MARRIGFATCAKYPDLAPSDRLTADLLRHLGRQVVPLVWTETSARDLDCDVIVIRSVWDYHLHVDRFLGWIDTVAQHTLVLNSPQVIRWNADKRYLFDIQNAGLPVPRMSLLEHGSKVDLPALLRSRHFRQAVIKPTVSASAFETHLVDDTSAPSLQPRIDELLLSRSLLIQEFVQEIEASGEWSLMFFGGEYSHAVRKLPRSGDFRVQAEHGGRHEHAAPPSQVLSLAQQVVAKFAAGTLYARIDIVEGNSGPQLMEVELIDPELFLIKETAATFVKALLQTCH